MFTQTTRLAARGAVLLVVVVTTAVGAGAPATAAGDFGEHVSTCTQTMGFTGDHNPGMHQGFRGWDPTHTC